MFDWFRNRLHKASAKEADAPLGIQPSNADVADALIKQGHTLEDEGDLKSALALYLQAADLAPTLAAAHLNAGNAYFSLGQLERAREAYVTTLRLHPQHAGAHFNMGNVLHHLYGPQQAYESYQRAVLLKPDFADAWIACGNVLGDMQRHAEAEGAFRHALALEPSHPECLRNLGLCLRQLGRLPEAAAAFEEALLHQSGHLNARVDLTNVLREMGEIVAAVEQAQVCTQLAPSDPGVRSLLLFTQSHNPALDPMQWFEMHKAFGQLVDEPGVPPLHPRELGAGQRLCIGFVTADLRNHAVASFFEPVFDALCKTESVDLIVYDTGGPEDAVTQRMKRQPVVWKSVGDWSDENLAATIRSDGVQLLVDLAGHTPGHRLRVFGKRVAPLQWTWIGYPGTTGMSSMDHALGDPHYLPLGRFDHLFSEKIIRLPANAPFTPFAGSPEVNNLPAFGRGHLTFGSFNRLDKITRESVAWWCAVLRETPDAQFVLAGMPTGQDLSSLVGWFGQEGISADRLQVRRRAGMFEYLQLHHEVDLCLDTFPYGGGTTTCHALWMGVPTVTRGGSIPAGHTSAAVLGQVGLAPRCVAENQRQFVDLAVDWSNRLGELQEVRLSMRERLGLSALGQPNLIAESFLVAARTALQRASERNSPESFRVEKTADGLRVERQGA